MMVSLPRFRLLLLTHGWTCFFDARGAFGYDCNDHDIDFSELKRKLGLGWDLLCKDTHIAERKSISARRLLWAARVFARQGQT